MKDKDRLLLTWCDVGKALSVCSPKHDDLVQPTRGFEIADVGPDALEMVFLGTGLLVGYAVCG